jgi:crossover junction endodeoxyribonuclease RuvC
MSYVIGLDPSLTSSGIATITLGSGVTAEARVVKTAAQVNPTISDRNDRLRRIAAELTDACRHAELVAIEGPALSRNTGHVWDRAGLWWLTVDRLLQLDLPLVQIETTVRAKWATGKGNASKTAVAVAMARMWPDVAIPDDNAADALALATIAAQQLGWTKQLARHRDALTTVRWPVAA